MQSREEYIVKKREYYHANKERLNASRYAKRATDQGKAKRREYARRHYLKYREEILAGKRASVDPEKRRAYYAANRDRISKWRRAYRQANLGKVRAQEAASRARRRLKKGRSEPLNR